MEATDAYLGQVTNALDGDPVVAVAGDIACPAAYKLSAGALGPSLTYEVDVSAAVTGDGPLSLRASSTSTNGARYVSKEGSANAGPRLVVTCA